MILIFLLTILTVVGVSFLCSLIEAVLLSLNPLELQVQEKKGMAKAGRWLVMKRNIERPISAILVFNTLANTGLATLAGAQFGEIFCDDWLWAFSVFMTALMLFGGEMTPKIMGVHLSSSLAPRLIGPLSWMVFVCRPIVYIMEKFCERLKRKTVGTQSQSDRIMDIITLVESARAEQLLHNQEEIIMIHAATLSARRVRSSMVPLEAVRVFHAGYDLVKNVQLQGPKLHRSYPVSAIGTLESVFGYIRVRELFVDNITHPGQSAWQDLIRPVLHVDGMISLTQLLALFLEKHEVAALVDGPEGSVIGWITMDDVTKVLMGARV